MTQEPEQFRIRNIWDRIRVSFAWRDAFRQGRDLYQENKLTGERRVLTNIGFGGYIPINQTWLDGGARHSKPRPPRGGSGVPRPATPDRGSAGSKPPVAIPIMPRGRSGKQQATDLNLISMFVEVLRIETRNLEPEFKRLIAKQHDGSSLPSDQWRLAEIKRARQALALGETVLRAGGMKIPDPSQQS